MYIIFHILTKIGTNDSLDIVQGYILFGLSNNQIRLAYGDKNALVHTGIAAHKNMQSDLK